MPDSTHTKCARHRAIIRTSLVLLVLIFAGISIGTSFKSYRQSQALQDWWPRMTSAEDDVAKLKIQREQDVDYFKSQLAEINKKLDIVVSKQDADHSAH